jgi:hypothetical protein
VRGIYLGNYVRWDPKAQHEQMISEYGYRTSEFSRTFDAYDYVDCFNYMNLHDQLKLCKHGFSKVTDHASREIRHGRLTREEGLALVQKHEQAPAEYSQLFLDWLGVTQRSMQFLLDQNRNKNFWRESSPGKWEFKGWSTLQEAQSEPLNLKNGITFTINDVMDERETPEYITVGKGHPR